MLLLLTRTLLCCLLLSLPLQGMAEEPPTTPNPSTEKLLNIQAALTAATKELNLRKEELKKADASQQAELLAVIQTENEELARLRNSLELIATGGLTIESINPATSNFDWQKELVDITRPLIDSLKQLTEKPRQVEQFRSTISLTESQQITLQKGLSAIEHERKLTDDKILAASLDALTYRWQERMAELGREKDVAISQLQALTEDKTDWQKSIATSLDNFFAGRLLTLFLGIGLGILVWLFLRMLNRWLWRNQATRRTAPLYRFLMYVSHAFVTLFVVCTVFAVFYIRGDVLLLGLGVIVLLAGLIGLQRTLPKFIREVNLLLNMGSAREGERVNYEGIPYLVQSLNVFSVLSNPYLSGVQRLPLEQLGGLLSRPLVKHEHWFPSRTGDALLLSDGTLVVVEQQSVERVIVRLRGGALINYTARQFFELNLTNLSHNDYFGVTTVFGLDYRHQDKILDYYPALIKAEIPKALAAAGIDSTLYKNVAVEFKTANASSLDLQIWVSFDRQLAERYQKLERILQGACVAVCNAHQLTIPFPQMSVHWEKV